jgi:YwiC-like protein
MRPEAKGYFLKEYGSWSVLVVSFLTGIGVSRDFTWTEIPLFLALGLLINSKQAFMKWLRKSADRPSLLVFVGQVSLATVILFAIFRSDIPTLLPLLIIPAAYLLTNKLAGEHFIVTELLGFALLSLAAVLAKFLLTGGVDVRLFVAVALYFTAGVFKIKTLMLKKTRDRILTGLHVLFSLSVYHRMHIALIILLPLIDNLVASAALYKVRLQTTGWIEVAKSLLFLALMLAYY